MVGGGRIGMRCSKVSRKYRASALTEGCCAKGSIVSWKERGDTWNMFFDEVTCLRAIR